MFNFEMYKHEQIDARVLHPTLRVGMDSLQIEKRYKIASCPVV